MRFKNIALLATLVAFSPLLVACGSSGDEQLVTSMTQEPRTPVDPSDGLLDAAVQQHLINIQGPKNSQYEYVRVDLNNDGLREGIVMFNLPHTYWCGWSGCTMTIFQAGDNDFALVSETKRVRGPLVVGETATNGWEDILVRTSGTDNADRNVALRYDGNAYPANPLEQADLPYDIASIAGLRIFP